MYYFFLDLLHPETAAKISMISSSECEQLLEKIPADQLEEKYGGTLSPPDCYWYRFYISPL